MTAPAPRKILILEDEPAVASVYTLILKNQGCTVTCAGTFEAARTLMRTSLPDILITDVRVGEYNGLQLAILFRGLSPSGRIFVISGHDDPVIRREAESLGAEFLLKPVDAQVLRQLVGPPPGNNDPS